MTTETAEKLYTTASNAVYEALENLLDSTETVTDALLEAVSFWEILAERDALQKALAQYADPNNWGIDEKGCERVWVKPDSGRAENRNGYDYARAALQAAQMAQEAEQ